MSTRPRSDEGATSADSVVGDESGPHPTWCRLDRPGALGGVEHLSGLFEWSPAYMSDVAVTGWLRHVSYPDGSEDTPVVVLQVDNPEQPGEIGMAAEDLASLAEHLLALRENLLEQTGADDGVSSSSDRGQSSEVLSGVVGPFVLPPVR